MTAWDGTSSSTFTQFTRCGLKERQRNTSEISWMRNIHSLQHFKWPWKTAVFITPQSTTYGCMWIRGNSDDIHMHKISWFHLYCEKDNFPTELCTQIMELNLWSDNSIQQEMEVVGLEPHLWTLFYFHFSNTFLKKGWWRDHHTYLKSFLYSNLPNVYK